MRLTFALAVPVALLILGCPAAGDDDSAAMGPYGPDLGGTAATDAPTWGTDIEPILRSYCSDCHDTGGYGPNWLPTYAAATTTALNLVCDGHARAECFDVRMANGSMPEGGGCLPGEASCITLDEYATVQQWIRTGTPE